MRASGVSQYEVRHLLLAGGGGGNGGKGGTKGSTAPASESSSCESSESDSSVASSSVSLFLQCKHARVVGSKKNIWVQYLVLSFIHIPIRTVWSQEQMTMVNCISYTLTVSQL